MPVGPVSSAANQEAKQPSPVLRSGEVVASNAAAVKSASAKTYYHMVPGARFPMPDGMSIQFLGGRFTTEDPAIIEELNKVVDRSASQIYSKTEARESVGALDKLAAEDAAKDQAPSK